MAGVTLTQAQSKLAEWLAADSAVAQNQAYTINGKSFTRSNAAEIRRNIDFWNGMVQKLSRSGSIRSFVVTPV